MFGHIKRMREDRIPKMIFEWNAEGRRRRGKKKTGKMDGWNQKEYEQTGIGGRRCARHEFLEK